MEGLFYSNVAAMVRSLGILTFVLGEREVLMILHTVGLPSVS